MGIYDFHAGQDGPTYDMRRGQLATALKFLAKSVARCSPPSSPAAIMKASTGAAMVPPRHCTPLVVAAHRPLARRLYTKLLYLRRQRRGIHMLLVRDVRCKALVWPGSMGALDLRCSMAASLAKIRSRRHF